MTKKVIFISGLGGTGKSTIFHYFLEHPLSHFSFFDFDHGKFRIPPYSENHLAWRTKQNKWWLKVANKEFAVKNNISVIVGQCLYPNQIIKLPEAKPFGKEHVHFVHLLTTPNVRKKRLIDRGDQHHFQLHKPWYNDFYKEMTAAHAFEIETSRESVKETAKRIQGWLKKMS